MGKIQKKHSLLTIMLIVSVLLMFIGSIAAWGFNTSGNKVKVSRISFETESGTLSGLLYLPKGVDASDPRPTIITTHGYLNSAEMQDETAIEMSRRGYVVLALDMYDHGHSKGNSDHTGSFFSFWPTAIYDAVSYMYNMDYVLKDSDGNGIIAVSGHSMGGFSSEVALYYDEAAYESNGYRMICAGLSMGADYSWTSYLTPSLDAATAASMFAGRTIGKVCAQYDEFFFASDEPPVSSGTVYHKDYVSTTDGHTLLENENPQADTWYDCSDGGKRIIYEPAQIHPWNHFSKTATKDAIEFYEVAFEGYQNDIRSIASTNQIWMFKELFELVALIGFIIFIPALASFLLNIPAFAAAKKEIPSFIPASRTISEKVMNLLLLTFSILFPAMIFPTIYDADFSAESMHLLQYGSDIIIFVAAIALIWTLMGKTDQKNTWMTGSVITIISGVILHYLFTKEFFSTGKVFQAPSVNSIVYWAVVCAGIGSVLMIGVYLLSDRKEKGITLSHYGISASAKTIIMSFIVAVITVVIVYALVFIVDAVFKTDFRIWTVAFKTFEASCIPAALKYMPFFFSYYFVSGVSAIVNTNTEKLQGFWGYILASVINMGGITIWLIWQYGKLFTTGVAVYPDQALSGILLFALVPCLAIASCFAKFLYKKTGHVYLAAFLNTILLTLMTVANTAVYFQ